MQPEPNNEMDELLKRLAKGRQERTGSEFELHPATRRALQNEVARTFPRPVAKPLFFFSLWPRLALMGVFTALLAMTLMVLNTPKTSKPTFQLSRRTDPLVSSAPAPLALETKEKSVSDTRADKDYLAKKPASAAEPSVFSRDTSAPQKLDLVEAARGGRGVETRSDPLGQIARDENRSGQRADKKLAANSASAKVPAKAHDEAVAPTPILAARTLTSEVASASMPIQGFADATSTPRRKFVQQDLRARFRQNLQSPPPTKILQSFEFIRVGNKIQFFDSDGSVYEGEILDTRRQDADKNELRSAAPDPSSFAFRAAGTNQRLHRLVTINGSFALTNADKKTNEPSPANTAAALNEGKIMNESDIGGITGGSIQGRISIGGTNEFEILAIELPR